MPGRARRWRPVSGHSAVQETVKCPQRTGGPNGAARPRRWVLAAAAVLVVGGCLQETRVRPSATDPAITTFDTSHVVVRDPAVPARGRLFVFLPGSFGTPRGDEDVVREAARAGLHAVGLTYPNGWTVHALCAAVPEDPDCEEHVRREILDGVDRSDLVTVGRSDSIQQRLVRLLQHLDREEPDAGWGAFLRGRSPRWRSIVVAGHSQGAGHAAMVARLHVVAGVVMFSSPSDTGPDGQPAGWLTGHHATPSDRYFGFVHVRDGSARILRSWEAIGVPGPPMVVDGRAPPYGGSHTLLTDVVTSGPHGSTVTDRWTPRRPDGTPAFGPVWRYLCCSG